MELSQEALEARRAYKREWAKNNKDKIKEANIRFWNRLAEKARIQEIDSLPKTEDS